MKNIIEKLNKCTVEQLKEIAIEYSMKFEVEEMIIADKINDMLIDRLPSGEFKIFSEKYL